MKLWYRSEWKSYKAQYPKSKIKPQFHKPLKRPAGGSVPLTDEEDVEYGKLMEHAYNIMLMTVNDACEFTEREMMRDASSA